MLAVRAAPLLVVPVAAQLVSGEGPLVWGSGLQLEHFGRGTVCKIPKPFWGGGGGELYMYMCYYFHVH